MLMSSHGSWKVAEEAHSFAVHAKVFDLVQGNGLILGRGLVRGLVTFGEGSESAYFDLPSRNGSGGVDNHRQPGLLILLVLQLSADIDAGEPATVPRVGMVPTDHVFEATDLRVGARALWCDSSIT